ncbi:hypothetical protein [Sphingomonas sp. SUN039]|uniref:helix-turn-helix transcriptional regulator n=1 Tax=Sphingomonas sp. SUN039 TaxID=2937787 RepID=UPI0021642802|nr:hypothetical protein [Sphingomonas sp. SUN039]UVO52836.1 hypothetical protein M0209_01385 [Sphingomonas sp. SUN039]
MAGDFESVLGGLYEAAVVRELWPQALQRFAELNNSRGALLTRGDRNHEGLLCSPGLNSTVAQFFEQDWHYRDLRTERCLPLVGIGFIADQHIISSDERATSAYYDGFARSAGVPWFTSAGIVRADGVCLAMSLQRSEAEGSFTRTEIARLNRMHGRLCEVLALGYRMSAERDSAMLRGLELVDRAAFLLDRRGSVQDMNTAAAELLDDVVTVRDRQLQAVDPCGRTVFSDWIQRSLPPGDPTGERRVIRLRDLDSRPWLAQAMPIAGKANDVFATGAVIVILSPAHAACGPTREMLAAAFGLTPTEARVAEQIAGGASVDEAAVTLSMTRNAVRFHLKSILPKADTPRQSTFVAAAAALVAR